MGTPFREPSEQFQVLHPWKQHEDSITESEPSVSVVEQDDVMAQAPAAPAVSSVLAPSVSTLTVESVSSSVIVSPRTGTAPQTSVSETETPLHQHRQLPLKNVYQQPLPDAKDFTPPVFEHTTSVRNTIFAALMQNYVLSHHSEAELEPLVSAFSPVTYTAGKTIIQQGDPGDFFYVLVDGKVAFEVNGVKVGEADVKKTTDTDTDTIDPDAVVVTCSFGELALLYTCPRAATVMAMSEQTHLFRVDQRTFRYILQDTTKKSEKEKSELLKKVPFFQNLTAEDLEKLSDAMTPRCFEADETLVRKGDDGDEFYVLQEGTVVCKDICVGNTCYADVLLHAGDYFGEYSLIKNGPRVANVVTKSKGVAFTIDRDCFTTVLGDMSTLIVRGQDLRKLNGVNFFQSLPSEDRLALADQVKDQTWSKGEFIVQAGMTCEARLFIVRKGQVRITDCSDCTEEMIGIDGYFGGRLLELASPAVNSADPPSSGVLSPYTVTVTEDCVCGVLTWECVQSAMENMKEESVALLEESVGDFNAQPVCTVELKNLEKHTILGQGTFGQVWMVSDRAIKSSDKDRIPYALKIQCKGDLIQEGQAGAVIREKDIMIRIKHPFIIDLVTTFQDDDFIYMLLELVQGGELFSVMYQHDRPTAGLPDQSAAFYALGIASALAYLHKAKFKLVFRDLKPENVMIDLMGYPRLIDFGFCKHVPKKTYTLCGTPGFLPPEVITMRGHNSAADHWSLGILIYEMVTGVNPFYFEGMEQTALFQSIVVDGYEQPDASPAAIDIINKLLIKDPAHRLGSLAQGEKDIIEHSWFDGIDLEALHRREIPAPWVPAVSNAFDTSCFDDWSELEDKTEQQTWALSPEEALLFADFAFNEERVQV